MRLHSKIASVFALGALLAPAPTAAQVAQEAVDLDVVAQIREEGLERSQIEALARHLTEVIGARLTGSPGMAEANAWTVEKFNEWSELTKEIDNMKLREPWLQFETCRDKVRKSGEKTEKKRRKKWKKRENIVARRWSSRR